jgi:hypothetical protein
MHPLDCRIEEPLVALIEFVGKLVQASTYNQVLGSVYVAMMIAGLPATIPAHSLATSSFDVNGMIC